MFGVPVFRGPKNGPKNGPLVRYEWDQKSDFAPHRMTTGPFAICDF